MISTEIGVAKIVRVEKNTRATETASTKQNKRKKMTKKKDEK